MLFTITTIGIGWIRTEKSEELSKECMAPHFFEKGKVNLYGHLCQMVEKSGRDS